MLELLCVLVKVVLIQAFSKIFSHKVNESQNTASAGMAWGNLLRALKPCRCDIISCFSCTFIISPFHHYVTFSKLHKFMLLQHAKCTVHIQISLTQVETME